MTELRPENVGDYPRPPALEWTDAPIGIRFGGQEIARSMGAWRVLETFHPPTYYIPAEAFADGTLVPSASSSTLCEWKGRASYFDIRAGGRVAERAAWTYPFPTSAFAALLGHVALYAEPMDDVTVAGTRVQPQPGNFYGGWVTSNITGPIKGAPGTTHW